MVRVLEVASHLRLFANSVVQSVSLAWRFRSIDDDDVKTPHTAKSWQDMFDCQPTTISDSSSSNFPLVFRLTNHHLYLSGVNNFSHEHLQQLFSVCGRNSNDVLPPSFLQRLTMSSPQSNRPHQSILISPFIISQPSQDQCVLDASQAEQQSSSAPAADDPCSPATPHHLNSSSISSTLSMALLLSSYHLSPSQCPENADELSSTKSSSPSASTSSASSTVEPEHPDGILFSSISLFDVLHLALGEFNHDVMFRTSLVDITDQTSAQRAAFFPSCRVARLPSVTIYDVSPDDVETEDGKEDDGSIRINVDLATSALSFSSEASESELPDSSQRSRSWMRRHPYREALHSNVANFTFSHTLTQLSAPIGVGSRTFQVSCSPAIHWLMRQFFPMYVLILILMLVSAGCLLLLRYHMYVLERHVLMMQQRDQFLQYFSHEIKNPLQVLNAVGIFLFHQNVFCC